MAKVSDEFCRKRFYRAFALMTRSQQQSVIEAFETIRELRGSVAEMEAPDPAEDVSEEADVA